MAFSVTGKFGHKSVPNGENIRFVCTYLWANPGAKGPEIRRALMDARGIPNDPKIRKGYYTSYVCQGWRYPQWECRRDGGFYLTQRGLAYVNP
jgi:hypothetical protein